MTEWWYPFFQNPLQYIGDIFAFMAAFAFLIFLRGILSGAPYLFTLDAHDEHMEHYRVRVIWGVMSLIAIFIVWEIFRVVISFVWGLFTY